MFSSFTAHKDKVKKLAQQVPDYLRYDLWHRELPPFFSWQGQLMRILRFVHMIIRGFREDKIRLHAASLTYNSLIALVPLLALSLAVLKGLGYGVKFDTWLRDYFTDYPAEFQAFITQILDAINKADFASVGGVGAAALVVIMVSVLNRIESSFNNVWGIGKARSWLRNFSNYLAIVVVVPFLLITAITVSARLQFGTEIIQRLGLLRLVPFAVSWAAFTFLYLIMPNTRVKFWAAFVSGFAGAVMWNAWIQIYIEVQPGVSRHNTFYGALAMIPVFLIWLYVNWTIVLLGAKVTFAVQNGGNYRSELTLRRANSKAKVLLSLSILVRCALALVRDRTPFQKEQFQKEHAVPPPLLNDLLALLTAAGLIAETTTEPGTYVLLRTPEQIDIRQIIHRVLDEGDDAASLALRDLDPRVSESLTTVFEQLDSGRTTVADLLPVEVTV